MQNEYDASKILIETLRIENGFCEEIRMAFGPHHFLEIVRVDGKVQFCLGTTHHGFAADASEVSSQLEAIIGEVRHAHPDLRID